MTYNSEKYEERIEYIEKMEGIIIDKISTSQSFSLKVDIKKPFESQIEVRLDRYFWNQYINYHYDDKWKGILEKAPEVKYFKDNYYNSQDQNFYIASDTEDNEWKKENFTQIINEAIWADRLKLHINSIFHTGQPCHFAGYAIDGNNRLHKPSTIHRDFEKYIWVYNPFTFRISPLDENTIDNLVEKIPISKQMTKKMLSYHNSKDKAQHQEKRKGTWGNLLNKFSKPAQFIEKHSTWFIAITSAIAGAIAGSLFTFFLNNLFS